MQGVSDLEEEERRGQRGQPFTYLRNSSGDGRTSDLALLAINPLRARALDSDSIIDAFALNHNNRRIVLL